MTTSDDSNDSPIIQQLHTLAAKHRGALECELFEMRQRGEHSFVARRFQTLAAHLLDLGLMLEDLYGIESLSTDHAIRARADDANAVAH